MDRIRNVFILIILSLTLLGCPKNYPDEFKVGTFITTTDLKTKKYLYRNKDYQYVSSEENPNANKLYKIDWVGETYTLITINQSSKFDSFAQTVFLDSITGKTVHETTVITDGKLKFQSSWQKIKNKPEDILFEKIKELVNK